MWGGEGKIILKGRKRDPNHIMNIERREEKDFTSSPIRKKNSNYHLRKLGKRGKEGFEIESST